MISKIGFDNEKYIELQSSHIRQRIDHFGGKLYLECGGKLFDDYHAARVLPGFAPDSKIRMLIQLKEQEFVIAAQAMGGKAPRIIMRHLIPNTLSVVIVNVTLAIPSAIFTEAWLSYLGLGVPVPLSSWGTLAQSGAAQFQTYPVQLVVPAVCICLTMLSFNLLGDGLRDAFDPRLRR